MRRSSTLTMVIALLVPAPAAAADAPDPLAPEVQRAIDEAVREALARERARPAEEAPAEAPAPQSEEARLKFVESNVVSLVGREGFRWQDREGTFLLNPYVLVQTRMQFLQVDDEGLDLADHDNVVDVGFGVPNAILGVAGKAYGRLSFNVAMNGACAGRGCLLNEAWLEGNVADEFRVLVGKFKTPMHWHVQTRLAGKMAANTPSSLTTRVNVPFDLNAANPVFATGIDLGVMVHGLVGNRFLYQVGIFSGEGVQVNVPTSNLSDDNNVPALLYGARLAWMPFGPPALEEGGPAGHGDLRLLLGASASYNVETNAESSNDLRAGLELVVAGKGWYWAAEGYLLHMDFMERLKNSPSYLFWGAHTVLGHTFAAGVEPFVRVDALDRNSTDHAGVLVMPGVGVNWYVYEQNLKLQALYQYLAKAGHDDSIAANDDDNGLAEHTSMVQLQFAF